MVKLVRMIGNTQVSAVKKSQTSSNVVFTVICPVIDYTTSHVT